MVMSDISDKLYCTSMESVGDTQKESRYLRQVKLSINEECGRHPRGTHLYATWLCKHIKG